MGASACCQTPPLQSKLTSADFIYVFVLNLGHRFLPSLTLKHRPYVGEFFFALLLYPPVIFGANIGIELLFTWLAHNCWPISSVCECPENAADFSEVRVERFICFMLKCQPAIEKRTLTLSLPCVLGCLCRRIQSTTRTASTPLRTGTPSTTPRPRTLHLRKVAGSTVNLGLVKT